MSTAHTTAERIGNVQRALAAMNLQPLAADEADILDGFGGLTGNVELERTIITDATGKTILRLTCLNKNETDDLETYAFIEYVPHGKDFGPEIELTNTTVAALQTALVNAKAEAN